MLKVNDFRAYITELENAIPELTASETVMDDSQITKFLEEIDADTFMVIGVIPKHNFVGKDENLQTKDTTSLLVMQKIERSEQLHEDFLDKIDELQTITKKVIDKLREDYQDEENCNFLKKLILPSFDVNPFWGLNSCDGYQIDFSLNTEI